MQRRQFLARLASTSTLIPTFLGSVAGCRGTQKAHVLNDADEDMVGSHTAGAETWEPLIDRTVSKLLARQSVIVQTSLDPAAPTCRKRICFVGVENKSAEELGDFKEQIYQKIDTCITQSECFEPIARRWVEAGLRECRLRPDDLFVPNKRAQFITAMEQLDQPFEYLLYATVTSGTTKSNNKDYQRDYLLTLELIDMETGKPDKESEEIRKGYHKSRLGKLKHYGAG